MINLFNIFKPKPDTEVKSVVFDRLYSYQKDAVQTTMLNTKGIVCMPTSVGKCLAKGTKILMYDGTIKKVEDIIVGDKIMGDDSKSRIILSLARGKEMMYNIIPKKGEKYGVNESHILSLKITNIGNDNLTVLDEKYRTGDIVDISVKDYLTLSKTAKHVLKGFRVGVDFENNNQILPIAPRLLGLWLADGTSSLPSFTVNDEDIETIKYLRNECEKLGLEFTPDDNSINSQKYHFRTKLRGNASAYSNTFLNLLRDNDLFNNKHIPHIYKTASRKDRLELLAGMLDGDGCLSNNCFDLTLKSEILMDDVIFIARSLGFACYKKKCNKTIKSINFTGEYFRINISGNIKEIPTIVRRKQAVVRLKKKDVLVHGIKIESVGVGEYFGFEIDGNRRFLLSDFTVTHNTFCQAAIIADDVIKNRKQFKIYVINAPRIMLSYQLLKEVYGFLVHEGIEARYMFVHSGGKTDEKELEEVRLASKDEEGNTIPFSEIGSGTSVLGIAKMMEKAKAQKLPLIFFSTYNSASNIEIARQQAGIRQSISIVLNDEAHYLVQEQFHDILRTLPSQRCYFFTATMIQTPSDKGRGMNNEESYGKVLYMMLPIDAILLGKMVRPRLHFVKSTNVYNTDDYNHSLNKIISDTFKQHEEVLKMNKHTVLLPKILVSARGTQDILTFLNSQKYQDLRNEGVDIYAVASTDEILNDINGEKVRRQDFLKRLKIDGEDKTKRLIVLHYDILAEGIDVSGFTGIMPLRTLNKSKFLQTYGRSSRPDKEDRKRIDAKEITSNDLSELNKPYSYIMIPNIVHSNEDDKANMVQLITELRTYGFKPSEDIVSSSIVRGIPEIEEPDGLNDLQRRIPNAGQIIEGLEAELEAESEAKLSKINLLEKLFN